jgi:hypothetical protein
MRTPSLPLIKKRAQSVAPKFSFACLAVLAAGLVSHVTATHYEHEEAAKANQQATMCLAENIYHEARGEPTDAKYLVGMVTLARVKDPDPQWPDKTICGVIAQDRQFSWTLDYKLATTRSEQKEWADAKRIARDLIENAWTRYVMPRGWECVRYYKRTDDKGVSVKSAKYFSASLFPVEAFGSHTAFEDRRGCKHPLPTN